MRHGSSQYPHHWPPRSLASPVLCCHITGFLSRHSRPWTDWELEKHTALFVAIMDHLVWLLLRFNKHYRVPHTHTAQLPGTETVALAHTPKVLRTSIFSHHSVTQVRKCWGCKVSKFPSCIVCRSSQAGQISFFFFFLHGWGRETGALPLPSRAIMSPVIIQSVMLYSQGFHRELQMTLYWKKQKKKQNKKQLQKQGGLF